MGILVDPTGGGDASPVYLAEPSVMPLDVVSGDILIIDPGTVDVGIAQVEAYLDGVSVSDAIYELDGQLRLEVTAPAGTLLFNFSATNGSAVTPAAPITRTIGEFGIITMAPVLIALPDGPFTATLSGTVYASTVNAATADAANGPINYARPVTQGSVGPGNTISLRAAGLWLWAEGGGPFSVVREWYEGAVAGAPLSIGDSHVVVDQKKNVILVEHATVAAGIRSVQTVVVAASRFITPPTLSPDSATEGAVYTLYLGTGIGARSFSAMDGDTDVTGLLTGTGDTRSYPSPVTGVTRNLALSVTFDNSDGAPVTQSASSTIVEAGSTAVWDIEASGTDFIITEAPMVTLLPVAATIDGDDLKLQEG